jgi:hypothetical protein
VGLLYGQVPCRCGEFFCTLAGECQNRLPSRVNNLNGKVLLLVRGQIVPLWNNLPSELCDPEPNLTCGLNVRQVKGLRVFDPAAAIAKEKVVLGHGCMLSYWA